MIDKKDLKNIIEDFIEHVDEILMLNIDRDILKFMIDDFIEKKIQNPVILKYKEEGYFIAYIQNKRNVMPIIAQIALLLCNDILLETEFGWIDHAPEALIFPLRLYLSKSIDKKNKN